MGNRDIVESAIDEGTGALATPARLEADPDYDHFLLVECDDYSDEPDGSRWYWGTTATGEPWSVIVAGDKQ
jgi:hypothetical protein